jgi:hypothetical protein
VIGPPDEISPSARAEADPTVMASTSSIVPQATTLRPVVAAAEADATAAPCRRCGHPLSAPRSVARGIGPVCMHLVAGESR